MSLSATSAFGPEDEVVVAVEAANGAAVVGRVLEAGARASGLAGARVLVGAVDACGECDVCRRGGAPVCPRAKRRMGGERTIRAAARWVVPLSESTDPAAPSGGGTEPATRLVIPGPHAAAIPGDVTLAYTLYARTGIGAREPAVVVGATPVARFLVEILLAKGITPTVVADASRIAWCAWLARRGAVVVPLAEGASDADTLAAVATAIAAQGIGARPWRLFVTDPSETARAAALAGPRATLTLLAPAPALPGMLVAAEVTVIGVAGPHPDLVVEVAALCVKGDIELADGTTMHAGGDPTRARLVVYVART